MCAHREIRNLYKKRIITILIVSSIFLCTNDGKLSVVFLPDLLGRFSAGLNQHSCGDNKILGKHFWKNEFPKPWHSRSPRIHGFELDPSRGRSRGARPCLAPVITYVPCCARVRMEHPGPDTRNVRLLHIKLEN